MKTATLTKLLVVNSGEAPYLASDVWTHRFETWNELCCRRRQRGATPQNRRIDLVERHVQIKKNKNHEPMEDVTTYYDFPGSKYLVIET